MKRLLAVLLLTSAAFAAEAYAGAEAPPERIVRASYVGGEASYQRGDADEWSALGVNTPLMTGDSIYTPEGARAEVSLGRGNFARLGEGTELDVVSLTSGVTQIGIGAGVLSVRVRALPEGSAFEVDTPFASAMIAEPGLYRIHVDAQRASYETVAGSMSIVLNGEMLDVGARETLALEGSDPPAYEYMGPRRAGPFESWADERDRRFEGAESPRYVNAEIEGQEDLDGHGSWRLHPSYGRVWIPATGPDWAPYQDGRWMWQDPYGWTWVSYEPWGWAPYHYGRWVFYAGAWAWVPPPPAGFVAARGVVMPAPVYAPALVAFIGGSNWSVSVSSGGGPVMGWVPLAPADPYYYPWQPAPTRVVRYTNVTIVNAVTVVHVNNFVAGGGRRIRVSRGDLGRAPVMGCSPRNIPPTRDSLAPYPHRRLRPEVVPVRAGQRRPLVARLVPPPKPMKFQDKAEVIHRTGRPVARPIAFDGDVGKPFRRGARVPDGVRVVSAISPEREARPMTRRGKAYGRAPRRVEAGDPIEREGRGGRREAGTEVPQVRDAGAQEPVAPATPPASRGKAWPGRRANPPVRGDRSAPGRGAEAEPPDPSRSNAPPGRANEKGGDPGSRTEPAMPHSHPDRAGAGGGGEAAAPPQPAPPSKGAPAARGRGVAPGKPGQPPKAVAPPPAGPRLQQAGVTGPPAEGAGKPEQKAKSASKSSGKATGKKKSDETSKPEEKPKE